MERAIEEVIRCDAEPDRVVEVFAHDPASVLSGRSSTDTSAFVAEMAVPLGAVGVVGDRLLGHWVAERSVRGFLEAAAARVDAVIVREDGDASSAARTADVPVTVSSIRSELYLG